MAQSAKVADFSEMRNPLFDNLRASGFNNLHDIPQRRRGNLRMIVAQITFSGAGNPYFRRVGTGSLGRRARESVPAARIRSTRRTPSRSQS